MLGMGARRPMTYQQLIHEQPSVAVESIRAVANDDHDCRAMVSLLVRNLGRLKDNTVTKRSHHKLRAVGTRPRRQRFLQNRDAVVSNDLAPVS